MGWIRQTFAFLLGVAVTAAIGAIASTHFVLASLRDLNVQVPIGKRLLAYGHDLIGMAPTLAVVVAVGFAIAFPVAAAAGRFLPRSRPIAYPLAGAAAIVTALLLMNVVLGMMPLAGVRSTLGIVAQGVAGAVGGYVFGAVSRRSRTAA